MGLVDRECYLFIVIIYLFPGSRRVFLAGRWSRGRGEWECEDVV